MNLNQLIEKKIWENIRVDNECWTFLVSYKGRSSIAIHLPNKKQKYISPHRYIYQWCFGPITKSQDVLRRCNNQACVNPLHLYIGRSTRIVKLEKAFLFWKKVNKSGGEDTCWPWTGATNVSGYGKFTFWEAKKATTVGAHRFSYLLANGPISDDLFVCHNCPGGDNKLCVNPKHLWLGTNSENLMDASRKGTIARGDRNGSRLYPERLAIGETNANAKLSTIEVVEIRKKFHSGIRLSMLAKEYSVSRSTLGSLIKRETWRHVE